MKYSASAAAWFSTFFALAKAGLRNGLPFVTLVGLWIVGYFVLRFREQRELDRELDELNNLASDGSRQGC